jgi:MoxR-like ATPase
MRAGEGPTGRAAPPEGRTRRVSQYVSEVAEHVRAEMRKVIVGQDPLLEQVLVAMLAEGHVLIEGVPGTGKTLTVKALARILNAAFNRIQFTPDLMPSDVTGTNIFNLTTGAFTLRQGPIFTDILLADEINRTPPKTQAALLEAMEERQATIDGERHDLSPIFTVLATQNPIEYEGTYPLPEAQLDRFLLKALADYPSEQEEIEVVRMWHTGFNARRLEAIDLRPLPDASALSACRAEVRQVRVEEGIGKYVVAIVRRTRGVNNIAWGASPRASVALLLCAKALAALRGRDFVTPDEVKEMALPVLRHRVVLRSEAELEGVTADQAISEVLNQVQVPR